MPIRVNGSTNIEGLTKSPTTAQHGDTDFGKILTQTQTLKSKELETFLTKLDTKGSKLAETLSLKELQEFKDMVRLFIRSTFGKSRKVSEDSYWDFRGRPKILARVKDIDTALEELGTKMIEKNINQLDILNRIGEIKGMIVDLFA